MDHEDYINEALEIVAAWEVPAESFAEAVNAQARLMAGLDLEISSDRFSVCPYSPLEF